MQDLYLTINFDTRYLQKKILVSLSILTREGGGHILEQIFGNTFCLFTHYSFFQTIAHTLKGQKYFCTVHFYYIILYKPSVSNISQFFFNFTKCV